MLGTSTQVRAGVALGTLGALTAIINREFKQQSKDREWERGGEAPGKRVALERECAPWRRR